MKVPFVGPSYEARSLKADAQRCLNCYLEMDNASPRAPLALYGTPGADLAIALDTSPVRGTLKLASGSMIVVSGNCVYNLNANSSPILLGRINSFSGPVGMAANTTQILIVDGINGWLATSTTLTRVTDVDFPSGVTWAKFLSSFFLVGGDGTSQFYWNETPNDGSAWNGLDFASAEGSPDIIIGAEVNQLELWLFGTASTEIFVLTGNADSPFERSGNTFLETGAVSAFCMAKLDSTVFWLGQDDRGTGVVWRAAGYSPARISNHAIEHAIQNYGTISDALAFTYQQEGHGFYVLTFPTEGKTWVYDVATQQWHERASYTDFSTNTLGAWFPRSYCFFSGRHYVGNTSGELLVLNLDANTENGTPIKRLRTTQCMDSPNGSRMFYQELIIDMETGLGDSAGSDPQVMLRYSNDGGHTWSNLKTASAGKSGEYGKRIKFGPTGSGRNRVWELSMTDDAQWALFGAWLRAIEGTS